MDISRIDQLQAGWELDSLVAQHVMKHKIINDAIFGMMEMHTTEQGENIYHVLRAYSRDLSCVRYVIEKMDQMAFHDETAYWQGEDRPEVICKAALRAVLASQKAQAISKTRALLKVIK